MCVCVRVPVRARARASTFVSVPWLHLFVCTYNHKTQTEISPPQQTINGFCEKKRKYEATNCKCNRSAYHVARLMIFLKVWERTCVHSWVKVTNILRYFTNSEHTLFFSKKKQNFVYVYANVSSHFCFLIQSLLWILIFFSWIRE